jgi:hypothetical protein
MKPEVNPLNTELNPICHLLALLGAHHILHISRVRADEDSNCYCQHYNYDSDYIPCSRIPLLLPHKAIYTMLINRQTLRNKFTQVTRHKMKN